MAEANARRGLRGVGANGSIHEDRILPPLAKPRSHTVEQPRRPAVLNARLVRRLNAGDGVSGCQPRAPDRSES